MVRLKRSILWACLIVIAVLAVLSIYGAFLGADRAQAFFNSVPVVIYWGAFSVLLAAGIVAFRRLLWVPSLLLMHLGCIFILAGGMWGSRLGQDLQKRFLGTERIRKGQMPVLEGTAENRVMVADSNDTKELPFSIRLRDFRIEYYEPGDLYIQSRDGKRWKLPAKAGRSQGLGKDLGTVTIQRAFRNFKMDISGDERIAYDAPGGLNPALEVTIQRPDGSTARRYVFLHRAGRQPQRSAGHELRAGSPRLCQRARGRPRQHRRREQGHRSQSPPASWRVPFLPAFVRAEPDGRVHDPDGGLGRRAEYRLYRLRHAHRRRILALLGPAPLAQREELAIHLCAR